MMIVGQPQRVPELSQELEECLRPFDGRGRTMLLPALLAVQERFGYVSERAADAVASLLPVHRAEISGVIEFYDLLSDRPLARNVVRFCQGLVCHLADGREAEHGASRHLNADKNGLTPNGEVMLTHAPCLGYCDQAPSAMINGYLRGRLTSDDFKNGLPEAEREPRFALNPGSRWLTERIGKVRPDSLEDFLATGGFAGLRAVLAKSPEEVIAGVKASGLLGRGGAAFPTGIKMEGVRKAGGSPKYAVLNVDESEMGTFKDRILLENDPFGVLEGFLIDAYAAGATYGYIYTRGEYRLAQDILATVVQQARQEGYLGKNILGSDFSFDVELRSGAGAYICGEETALFESIEGKRGFPRMKPPFPTTYGVFGKPTVINNVETVANLPLIFRIGAEAYRALGTQDSAGPKLFCLAGDVNWRGLVEVPFGITLRRLIEEYGGGVRNGNTLQAVLLGGAAGMFVHPSELDVPLTFEGTRAAGLSIGSGAVMVIDDTRDLRKAMLDVAVFFAHESCGKCYPCQLGTQRQLEIAERLNGDGLFPGDIERLTDVSWTMTDASLCGLGQTAGLAALSAMKHWPELFVVSNRMLSTD